VIFCRQRIISCTDSQDCTPYFVVKISLTYKTGLPIVQPGKSNVLSKRTAGIDNHAIPGTQKKCFKHIRTVTKCGRPQRNALARGLLPLNRILSRWIDKSVADHLYFSGLHSINSNIFKTKLRGKYSNGFEIPNFFKTVTINQKNAPF